jgi:hypothetical protein
LTRHKVAIKILNRRKIQAMDMEEKGVIIEHEFHRLSKPGMSAPKGAGHACRGQSMEVDVRGRAWCVGRSSVLVGVCGWMGGGALKGAGWQIDCNGTGAPMSCGCTNTATYKCLPTRADWVCCVLCHAVCCAVLCCSTSRDQDPAPVHAPAHHPAV